MFPSANLIPRIIFTAAVLALLLLSFTLLQQVNGLLRAQDQVGETYLLRLRLEQTLTTMKDAETAQRGFLLTKDSLFLEPYTGAYERAQNLLKDLRLRTARDPEQQRAINKLSNFIEVRFKTFSTVIGQYNQPGLNADTRKQHLLKGKSSMDSIRHYSSLVEQRAINTGKEGQALRRQQQIVTPFFAFLFIIAAIGMLSFSYYQITKALKRTRDLLHRLKRMNRSLKEKNVQLERTNKELDSFTYIASHDLKEPLRKITTFCSMIEDQGAEAAKLYFPRIRQSVGRMQRLLNDLLHYSQVTQEGPALETVSLAEIVHSVSNEVGEELFATGGTISMRTLPQVKGIPFQLHQLFENLICNALKYHQKDTPPRILLSAYKVNRQDVPCPGIKRHTTYYQVRIRDNGAGFKPEYADKIFEPFQRLPTVDHREGTGIGLTICRKIMQNHDGFIRAESQPDEGSLFELYFPDYD
jgi:signal transduction histidine kinase